MVLMPEALLRYLPKSDECGSARVHVTAAPEKDAAPLLPNGHLMFPGIAYASGCTAQKDANMRPMICEALQSSLSVRLQAGVERNEAPQQALGA